MVLVLLFSLAILGYVYGGYPALLRVLVRDGAGHPIFGHVLSAGQPLSLRLPPASYLLEVSTAKGRARMVPVTLAAGGSEVVLE